MPVKDMIGKRFSRLVVIGRAESDANGNAMWHCRCDCGAITTSRGFTLRNGQAKSCGCLTTEQLKERVSSHGLAGTPEYRVWAGMLQRCNNPKTRKFHLYGGRGIKVCERWRKFENFYADMGQRPSPEHSIERADSNGDYTPENCRWASDKEQANNTTQNRIVLYRGQTMSLQQAIDAAGGIVSHSCARSRIERGWDADRAVDTPAGQGKPRMVGKRFGRWTVIDDDISDRSRWACRCDCGTVRNVNRGTLRSGESQSCGCLLVDSARQTFTTHGKSGTPEFYVWASIRGRCSNKNLRDYRTYGGRGIKICERWDASFEDFLADVGLRPSPRHRLLRRDVNGHYEPGNCTWAIRGDQVTSRTTYVKYRGEHMTMTEALRRSGIVKRTTAAKRIKSGWSVDDALDTPVGMDSPGITQKKRF